MRVLIIGSLIITSSIIVVLLAFTHSVKQKERVDLTTLSPIQITSITDEAHLEVLYNSCLRTLKNSGIKLSVANKRCVNNKNEQLLALERYRENHPVSSTIQTVIDKRTIKPATLLISDSGNKFACTKINQDTNYIIGFLGVSIDGTKKAESKLECVPLPTPKEK